MTRLRLRPVAAVCAGGLSVLTLLLLPGFRLSAQERAPERALPDRAAGAPAAVATGNGEEVSLNFKDAELESVVGAFGHLLGRTFIVDPRVRGKLTLETPRPISRAQAYKLLQSTLRMQGFSVVEADGVIKVVPEADAKLQQGPVAAGAAGASGVSGARAGDQIVTQIFRLQHESATNLVTVVRPLVSPNNTVTAYPNNNSLVVTDYAANLQRIARIVESLDTAAANEVEVVRIQHALAADIATTLTRMLDDSARIGGATATQDPGQRIAILADPRSNSVMIRSASAARVALAKSLAARLDQPSATPGNINVVNLRNAEAVRLVQVLRSMLSGTDAGTGAGSAGGTGTGAGGFGAGSGMGGSGFAGGLGGATGSSTGSAGSALGTAGQTGTGLGAPLGGSPGSSFSSPGATHPGSLTVNAGGAIIAADPATNSLIITAAEPLYRNLRAVIDRLDVRRAQVYIESLIVEVTSERAAEFGIQWQMLGSPDGSTRVIGGTNLPARGSGSNILDTASNLGTAGQGLNLGVVRGTVNVPGVGQVLNLPLLARALESDAAANILATPNLLTLDNEEARIIIGQNVPFVTGQYTLPGTGTTTVSPFQTIERRDVGTSLRVKPQVSESGTVKLQIFQEVSSVADTSLSAGLIINRRAIESQVLVDDGQIVVLGGLLGDQVNNSTEKVPGLGNLPLIGNLFRYESRSRSKTNLLVFLRPVVVRDARSAYDITVDRYDYIRQLQGQAVQPNHWVLPSYNPDDLPPMTTKPGEPAVPGRAPSSLSPDLDRSTRQPAPVIRLDAGAAAPTGSSEPAADKR
jgi:general secretion pathway protein D